MPRGMSIHQGTGPQFTHVNYNNQQWTYIDIVSTSNWQHWRLSRYTAAHRRISQRRASQCQRPVAVSTRLAPSHASYRGSELVWATGHLMSPDHSFGTSCLLHCGRLTVSANSKDSWKRFCLSRTSLRRLVTLVLGAIYKYSYLLT